MLNYEGHVVRRYHLQSAVEKRNGTEYLSGLEIVQEEATSLPREFTEALFMEKVQCALNNIFNTLQLYLYSTALKEL